MAEARHLYVIVTIVSNYVRYMMITMGGLEQDRDNGRRGGDTLGRGQSTEIQRFVFNCQHIGMQGIFRQDTWYRVGMSYRASHQM